MIKTILAEESDESCEADVDILHDTLLQLPAEKYIALYLLMKNKMEDYYGWKHEAMCGDAGCL